MMYSYQRPEPKTSSNVTKCWQYCPTPQYPSLAYVLVGARGGVVVKALHYKPAGRGFDSRWCHWNFSVT